MSPKSGKEIGSQDIVGTSRALEVVPHQVERAQLTLLLELAAFRPWWEISPSL